MAFGLAKPFGLLRGPEPPGNGPRILFLRTTKILEEIVLELNRKISQLSSRDLAHD